MSIFNAFWCDEFQPGDIIGLKTNLINEDNLHLFACIITKVDPTCISARSLVAGTIVNTLLIFTPYHSKNANQNSCGWNMKHFIRKSVIACEIQSEKASLEK